MRGRRWWAALHALYMDVPRSRHLHLPPFPQSSSSSPAPELLASAELPEQSADLIGQPVPQFPSTSRTNLLFLQLFNHVPHLHGRWQLVISSPASVLVGLKWFGLDGATPACSLPYPSAIQPPGDLLWQPGPAGWLPRYCAERLPGEADSPAAIESVLHPCESPFPPPCTPAQPPCHCSITGSNGCTPHAPCWPSGSNTRQVNHPLAFLFI